MSIPTNKQKEKMSTCNQLGTGMKMGMQRVSNDIHNVCNRLLECPLSPLNVESFQEIRFLLGQAQARGRPGLGAIGLGVHRSSVQSDLVAYGPGGNE